MSTSVKLPQWGMSMAEGTITEWLVAPGEAVTRGQELAEVEAAKVTNRVTAPADGVIGALLVAEGQTVEVNTVLTEILQPGESPVVPGAAGSDAGGGRAATTGTATTSTSAGTDAGDDGIPRDPAAARAAAGRVTGVVPLARKLARKAGLDLRTISGTGSRGRIVVADVKAAIERATAPAGSGPDAQPAAAPGGGARLTRMRQVIGERMTASLRHSAQLTLTTTADVTDFAALREEVTAGLHRPGHVAAVIRACALALRRHPGVNAHLDGQALVRDHGVHIGVAVALDEGLVVPVIRDADRLGLARLNARVHQLSGAARAGQLSPDDYTGARSR